MSSNLYVHHPNSHLLSQILFKKLRKTEDNQKRTKLALNKDRMVLCSSWVYRISNLVTIIPQLIIDSAWGSTWVHVHSMPRSDTDYFYYYHFAWFFILLRKPSTCYYFRRKARNNICYDVSRFERNQLCITAILLFSVHQKSS